MAASDMDERDFATYLDIALVAAALFVLISWLKSARAGLAVAGGLILALVYLVAVELRLELTAWAFKGAFAVFVIVLVLVLQNDLRRLFEQVASIGSRVPRSRRKAAQLDVALETAFELASRRWGALIVIAGRDPVERYIEGGERLDGRLSRPLILSLFDPGSIGHDGAVILDQDGLVKRFAAHLPLSANFHQIGSKGTRHSAAVGLSEVTDALCVCVSEERGEVSIARQGKLELVQTIEDLRRAVSTFIGARFPTGSFAGRTSKTLRRHWADAALAVVLSVGLWQFFVAGTQLSQKTVTVAVLIENIDPGYQVEAIEPPEVKVELSGLRRDLYLLDPAAVEVRLDASLVALGRRTFQISPYDVEHPPDLTVQKVSPDRVHVFVRPAEKQESSPPQS
jgi:diadenylate cyclase